MTVIYVAPFLGAGADWLCTLSEWLVPPVAWMGGKRRLAPAILRVLGVLPSSRPHAILGDACWWGWVWPLLLGPRGPEVCTWLRSWGREEPRELWFRLRDAGPAEDAAERAAGLLWLQGRAASGVPVWWDQCNLIQWASTRIDEAGQRQARSACAKGYSGRAEHKQISGGILRTATVAERVEAIRTAARSVSVEVHHEDANILTAREAPRLATRARVYLDPPYQGATGYPAMCSREDVLAIAEAWASYGARVAVSEAVDLSEDLGAGWSALRLRDGRKPEWLTTFGCDLGAARGPLFTAREGP